jgi:hypothetical protein
MRKRVYRSGPASGDSGGFPLKESVRLMKTTGKTSAKPRKKAAHAQAPDDARHRIFSMPFAKIYPAWLNKIERKQRSRAELDQVIRWLTGYTAAELKTWTQHEDDLGAFFDRAPDFNRAAELIKGTVCGVRVEEVAEPSMRRLRQLDKLVDELAQGKAMEKILRKAEE